MQYLKVKNWEKFQHYKERNPPWIKLQRELLRDYEFGCLQDASKLHLILIWLLASQLDNKIPNDPVWIAKQIGVTGKVDLSALIDSGFLVASGALAECKQVAMPETETEAYKQEADIKSLPGRFDEFWQIWPAGHKTAKKKCAEIWKRKRLDAKAETILADIPKRLANCAKWKNGFIPNPSTYLNQERWEDDFAVPNRADMSRVVPRDDNELIAFAAKHHIAAKVGESMHDFRQRVQRTVSQ